MAALIVYGAPGHKAAKRMLDTEVRPKRGTLRPGRSCLAELLRKPNAVALPWRQKKNAAESNEPEKPTTDLDATWSRHARASRAFLHSSMGRRHSGELRPNERRRSAWVSCIPEQCVNPSAIARDAPADSATPLSSTTNTTTRMHDTFRQPRSQCPPHAAPHHSFPCHSNAMPSGADGR